MYDVQIVCSVGQKPEEKRMIIQSLMAQLRNRFHVSAAEIGEQNSHYMILIGIASVIPHQAVADRLSEEIYRFIESLTDAAIIEETKEIR